MLRKYSQLILCVSNVIITHDDIFCCDQNRILNPPIKIAMLYKPGHCMHDWNFFHHIKKNKLKFNFKFLSHNPKRSWIKATNTILHKWIDTREYISMYENFRLVMIKSTLHFIYPEMMNRDFIFHQSKCVCLGNPFNEIILSINCLKDMIALIQTLR